MQYVLTSLLSLLCSCQDIICGCQYVSGLVLEYFKWLSEGCYRFLGHSVCLPGCCHAVVYNRCHAVARAFCGVFLDTVGTRMFRMVARGLLCS